MNHEPQTIGGLFKDLEYELNTLAISMELFINILCEIVEKLMIPKTGKLLRCFMKNQLDFTSES